MKAVFWCNIYHEDTDEIIEEDFNFDEIECDTNEELQKYIKNCGYEIGCPCGFWGNNVGILTDISVRNEV